VTRPDLNPGYLFGSIPDARTIFGDCDENILAIRQADEERERAHGDAPYGDDIADAIHRGRYSKARDAADHVAEGYVAGGEKWLRIF
jgi:hypothetical protein